MAAARQIRGKATTRKRNDNEPATDPKLQRNVTVRRRGVNPNTSISPGGADMSAASLGLL